MALTFDQIHQLALNAGFTGQSANTISAISLAESHGNPYAFNPGDPHGGSFGLTQINGVHPGASDTLGNPQEALNQAFVVSKGGTNFSPWTTYTRGTYANYLPSGSITNASGNNSFLGGTENGIDLSSIPTPVPQQNSYVQAPGGFNSGLIAGNDLQPPASNEGGYSFGGSSFIPGLGNVESGLTNPSIPSDITSVGTLSPDLQSVFSPFTDQFGSDLFPGASGLNSTSPFVSNQGVDAQGNPSPSSSPLSTIFAAIGNLAERGGYILLGLILLAIAAYALTRPNFQQFMKAQTE